MSIDEAHAAVSRADSVCRRCGDTKIVVYPDGDYAHAFLCPKCMSPCPECDGERVTLTRGANGALVSEPCTTCGPHTRRIRLFNEAGIPRRYASQTFETFDERDEQGVIQANPAKLRLYKMTDGFSPGQRGLGVSGPVGTGKTHLMCALVRELTLRLGIPCRFVEFSQLLSRIRAGYDQGFGEARILGELTSMPVLVIDELGKGLSTEWQVAILDELVSRRYNDDVTTFFTTNFPFEGTASRSSRDLSDEFRRTTLEEKIGERMFSRLAEMCEMMRVDGTDFRKRSTT